MTPRTTATQAELVTTSTDVLTGWLAPDPVQEELRTDFVRWATEHPDATNRSCAPHHLTASALVVSADLDHVALVLHPKFGRWLQTGGHIEPGDLDVAAAAGREAREESGIAGLVVDPDPVLLSRHRVRCWPGGDHLDVQFVAVAPAGAVLTLSEESDDVRWFAMDALPEVDDSVTALVTAARTRLRGTPPPARDAGDDARVP